MERILSRQNIEWAWKRVKADQGAPGVDGITIDRFPDQTRALGAEIRASLATGSYLPQPVLREEIPKPTGGMRPLGIPTVLDRLIQQFIAQILTPIFDPEFSESSFGFRLNRSAHDAMRQLRKYFREGYRIAVDIDLAKCFDTVNHDLLMHFVSRKVHDKWVLLSSALIRSIYPDKFGRLVTISDSIGEPLKRPTVRLEQDIVSHRAIVFVANHGGRRLLYSARLYRTTKAVIGQELFDQSGDYTASGQKIRIF